MANVMRGNTDLHLTTSAAGAHVRRSVLATRLSKDIALAGLGVRATAAHGIRPTKLQRSIAFIARLAFSNSLGSSRAFALTDRRPHLFPAATSPAAIGNVRFTSIRDVQS